MLQDKETNGFDANGRGDSLSGKPYENESKFLESLNLMDESEAWTMFFKEFYPRLMLACRVVTEISVTCF